MAIAGDMCCRRHAEFSFLGLRPEFRSQPSGAECKWGLSRSLAADQQPSRGPAGGAGPSASALSYYESESKAPWNAHHPTNSDDHTRNSWCTYPIDYLFRNAAAVLIQGEYQSASKPWGKLPMIARIGGAAAVVARIF